MALKPKGRYRFPDGAEIVVTIPVGVTAWSYPQRENLRMIVNHPFGGVFIVVYDWETITAKWHAGTDVLLEIKVAWIVGRQRVSSDVAGTAAEE